MTKNYFGSTDTGRVRQNNEDTFIAEPIMNNRYIAACAIDGVGGYEGGEVAAQIARDTILDYLRIPSGEVLTMLREAISAANEKIFAERQNSPRLADMACVVTLALADIENNKFYYAHVGDTRLYLFRDQTLVKITRDQSFVGFLEDSGRLSEEAAMSHPKRNEINKALGFDARIATQPDYIETGESPFLPGDLLMLCSDGLTDLVDNRTMTSILLTRSSLQEKTSALIDAANNAGGKDNITVVLVHNNTKPIKQVATKPVAVKKKQREQQEESPVIPPVRRRKQGGGKAMMVLVLLCVFFGGGFLWLLYSNYRDKKAVEETPVVQKDPREQRLSASLASSRIILMLDSTYGDTLRLTEPLLVGGDTLHIRGNGLVLKADSTLKGPGLIFSGNCKKVLLDSLTLDGFDVALAVQNRGVRLKNVRFINCRIPIQSAYPVPGNLYVNGTAGDTILRTDSLPK
jgi:serine/threonine protein phosphatase PrpC